MTDEKTCAEQIGDLARRGTEDTEYWKARALDAEAERDAALAALSALRERVREMEMDARADKEAIEEYRKQCLKNAAIIKELEKDKERMTWAIDIVGELLSIGEHEQALVVLCDIDKAREVMKGWE